MNRNAISALIIGGILLGGTALTTRSDDLPDAPVSQASRTGDCTICQRMVDRSLAEDLDQDPHTFACAQCHHPHTDRTTVEWKNTCSSVACHPRAWTETVFHRLDAEVFIRCVNCHKPHQWSLNGEDCQSCHGESLGTETTPVQAVEGVTAFPHGNHESLACTTCHSTQSRHGKLLLTEQSQCQSCHHNPESGVECASCHGSADLPAGGARSASFTIAGKATTRKLPFDHTRHAAALECKNCHTGSNAYTAGVADCAGCHGAHPAGATDCATCHQEPTGAAHDLAVHSEGCAASGCHNAEHLPWGTWTRNLCGSCHTGYEDHNPGAECASCHRVPLPVGGFGQ